MVHVADVPPVLVTAKFPTTGPVAGFGEPARAPASVLLNVNSGAKFRLDVSNVMESPFELTSRDGTDTLVLATSQMACAIRSAPFGDGCIPSANNIPVNGVNLVAAEASTMYFAASAKRTFGLPWQYVRINRL